MTTSSQRDALRADLNLVETQLSRNLTLEADSLVSQDQLDILRARNLSLTAQIAALEARLSRMTVRAPFAGKMGIYTQRVGDLMRVGEVLTTLTGLTAMRWIDFKVPQGLPALWSRIPSRSVTLTASFSSQPESSPSPLRSVTKLGPTRSALNKAPALKHGSLVQVAVATGPLRT